MPRWSRIALKTLAVIFILVLIAYISAAIYVNTHKKALLASISKELNKNLDGSLVIGSMEPTLLRGFPGVSIALKNVVMKDRQWSRHRHTLLTAKTFDVSVNAVGLLTGSVEINKMTISDASIYLYTDSAGYTNTSIFKKNSNPDTAKNVDGSSSMEIRRFNLSRVKLVFNNEKGNKLFNFNIDKLAGKLDYQGGGWTAKIDLDAFATSLAFNTRRGSFIENKTLSGPFEATYDEDVQTVTIKPNTLKIGGDPFVLAAKFILTKDPTEFSISIKTDGILWRHASALLAPNIRKRLNQFNLEKPINVTCNIAGNMGPGGDPKIVVVSRVANNKLTTPGGVVDSCFFTGMYTNNYTRGKGNTDSNSVVRITGFKGLYENIPVQLDTASISNFIVPVATGRIRSKFAVNRLNNVVGTDLIKFTDGIADLDLRYAADLINLRLSKPVISGSVKITGADLVYVPRNLRFKDTDIALKFIGPDLFLNNLRIQSGKSIVSMGGSVKNFMNLYYTAPEKIIFNWDVKSPQLYLGEFLGLLNSRTTAKPTRKKKRSSNFSENLNQVFERSKMDVNLRVDKMYYKKFLATDATARLFVSEEGIAIQGLNIKHAGGALSMDGNLFQQGTSTRFVVNSTVKNANIRSFFYGFDNFGMESLSHENLKGSLFSKIRMEGRISNTGILNPSSLNGTVAFDLKNGALLNFDPLISVGKFAFPLRDLNNITFTNLNGFLRVNGDKVTIKPMKVSSSVLNVDVAGIYSMGKGTNIALDVPLRNPKKDSEITSAKEKSDKRMSGIVLHLLATDGEDGKIKIKLNRNRDKRD
jgi:hypothetical protein